jgi:tryptophan-rich sensory protein
MLDVELSSLALSIFICVSLALLGNVWVGDALHTWYKGLIKPKFLVPLWGFYTVGIVVYLLDAIVLYRLLVFIESFQGKSITLTAMIVVMIYNEAWNYAFFGVRSALAGLVGIVAFLAPLTILMVALFQYEVISGWLLVPYCGWVMYDVGWVYRLWQLNLDPSPRNLNAPEQS